MSAAPGSRPPGNPPPAVAVERAGRNHHAGLVELFEAADVPCFCQYFGFEGDHRAWQNRCANARSDNRDGLEDDLGRSDFHGLVASREARIVGWCRLAPPHQLAKTYQNRLYKNLPCLDSLRDRVLALACFLVHPTERRSGVATALLAFAIEEARSQGAAALEAFPRGVEDVTDGEQWTGPLSMYRAAGFCTVHAFAPYPVLRLDL